MEGHAQAWRGGESRQEAGGTMQAQDSPAMVNPQDSEPRSGPPATDEGSVT